jgi:uncharacterized protein (DUF2252 family)
MAKGREARRRVPLSAHGAWAAGADRPDPIALIEEQNRTRDADLVPVRRGRMMVSPFTFFRGAARIMASDLSRTPNAGLIVQLCGDAHLSNFGMYASPELELMFDVNDFDETLPGPFEYDVKRMATSFTIAAHNNAFSTAAARSTTSASVAAYRNAMGRFARMGVMDIWSAHLDEAELQAGLRQPPAGSKKAAKKTRKQTKREEQILVRTEAQARTRDSLQALSKLGELVDGRYRIVSQPPIVVPLRELAATYGISADEVEPLIHQQFVNYRSTLPDDRRRLLEQFRIVDMARKVVGVGSVGTRDFVVLLQGRDQKDPLFLQVKEATSSVLEDHLPKSRYENHGERVVQGQLLMQAASDIFLSWTTGVDVHRNFYWRQLRDMKASADVESMRPAGLTSYAAICGWALARAHARSGDPIAIATYLGTSDAFDRAVTAFSERYAAQNEGDYKAFVAEVRSGKLAAREGV